MGTAWLIRGYALKYKLLIPQMQQTQQQETILQKIQQIIAI